MLTTSLEVSLKLEKAGIPQESEFYWSKRFIWDAVNAVEVIDYIIIPKYSIVKECSAYLLSELLDKLTNGEIEEYIDKYIEDSEDFVFVKDAIIDLFRSPNKLAEVLLWKTGKEGK